MVCAFVGSRRHQVIAIFDNLKGLPYYGAHALSDFDFRGEHQSLAAQSQCEHVQDHSLATIAHLNTGENNIVGFDQLE